MTYHTRIPMSTSRRLGTLVAGSVALAAALAACSDTTSTNQAALMLGASNAFVSAPAGFSQLTSSFSADNGAAPFEPQFDEGRGPGGPGGSGGSGGHDGRGGPGDG